MVSLGKYVGPQKSASEAVVQSENQTLQGSSVLKLALVM